MKLAQQIRLGAWFLIALNLMMAFGSIWVFMRMAPAIEIIIEQNERSLHACEEMLSSLVLSDQSTNHIDRLKSEFETALKRAKNNITEDEEPDVIETIGNHYAGAFEGDKESMEITVASIRHLSQINRTAMVKADHQARQFGNAGAWGIVFMASGVFVVGMLFMKSLKRNLVKPLVELHSVVVAVKAGDQMRRCTGPDAPADVRAIFNELNEILDQNTSHCLKDKKLDE